MAIKFYRVRGEKYGAFSNFSSHGFTLKGKRWATSEHYYQAQKFAGTPHEEEVRLAGWAGGAAQMGRDRKRPLRPDWEEYDPKARMVVKEAVMYEALHAKFTQNPELTELLLSTRGQTLVEESPVDGYWGTGPNKHGLNRLGFLLEVLRDELDPDKVR